MEKKNYIDSASEEFCSIIMAGLFILAITYIISYLVSDD